VTIDGSGVAVASTGDLTVNAGNNLSANGLNSVSVESGSGTSLNTGTGLQVQASDGDVQVSGLGVDVSAGSVALNGSCEPVARMGDSVTSGSIVSGSPTVSAC
jgi:hypothetical protein